jgi:hypothetical protein
MGKWPSQKKGKREGKERKGKSKGETSFPNPAKRSSVLLSLAEGRGGGAYRYLPIRSGSSTPLLTYGSCMEEKREGRGERKREEEINTSSESIKISTLWIISVLCSLVVHSYCRVAKA